MSFQSPAQSSLTTRTGRNLCIRRAVAADEAALEAFFEQVTLEDLRFRFLSAVQHVGHDQIAAMLRTDQQAESVLAFAEDGALVGVATLAAAARRRTAEVAVSVASDGKGQGIWWGLRRQAAKISSAPRISRLA